MSRFSKTGEDPAAAFEERFPWAGHVHIEHIAPNREHNHLVAGLSATDFPAVFSTMKRMDYRHNVSLERCPCTDRPDETGRRSLAYQLPMCKEAEIER